MPAFIVAYDLSSVGQQYDCIKGKLEAYGTYWHFQQSVWLIETDETAEIVRDKLNPCIDSNDRLFVAELQGEAAWSGYEEDGSKWMIELLSNGFR